MRLWQRLAAAPLQAVGDVAQPRQPRRHSPGAMQPRQFVSAQRVAARGLALGTSPHVKLSLPRSTPILAGELTLSCADRLVLMLNGSTAMYVMHTSGMSVRSAGNEGRDAGRVQRAYLMRGERGCTCVGAQARSQRRARDAAAPGEAEGHLATVAGHAGRGQRPLSMRVGGQASGREGMLAG